MTSTAPSSTRVHWVGYEQDSLAELANLILQQHAAQLPRLDDVTVLLPDPAAARSLRQHLVRFAGSRGFDALLGPRIRSLKDWVQDFAPAGPRCHDHARRLLLVEALRAHPKLSFASNPWAVADGLLQLFDELTLNQISLPDTLAGFNEQLATAYGITQPPPTGLSRESSLVFTIWQAWHAQLAEAGQTDPQNAYLLALDSTLKKTSTNETLYLAGYPRLSRAEQGWVTDMLNTGRLHLLLQGRYADAAHPVTTYHPDTNNSTLCRQLGRTTPPAPTQLPYETVLDSIYGVPQPAFFNRARTMAQQFPNSPLVDRLAVFAADSHEEEAHAVELQVRRWLVSGHRHIAIVTEDRKLARRVRALLERAEVQLADLAGWALSTTSAAAVLERWLACVEEDFAYLPLLDLLKSPFFGDALQREQRREATYRFERDIVHRENIGSNLDRYRHGVAQRLERLREFRNWSPTTASTLQDCFAQLEHAAQELTALRKAGQAPAAAFVAALKDSLDELEISTNLAADPAGQLLLQNLEHLAAAARQWPVSLDWSEFRTWFGQSLEQQHFRPSESASAVQLLGLGQSALQHFDAIIIAGADRDHLPAAESVTPFFNDNVRHELGLPTRSDSLADQLHHFRRLLSAADHVLITHCGQYDGEPVPASPWLAVLQAFHQLAWHLPLRSDLSGLLAAPETLLHRCPDPELPKAQPAPAPSLTRVSVPHRFSATGYQQLMDCPYQFYAARCLQLSAPEEIQLALSKGDYGERIHTCLQAFHADIDYLPGPFTKPFSAAHRNDAIELLEEISGHVFRHDLRDHFEHLGWLRQWQQLIPRYVDWQIARSSHWHPIAAELKKTQELGTTFEVHGRIDRIDSSETGLAILDYKTGTLPSQIALNSGEAVQLPFYTLLADEPTHVQEVVYVRIDPRDGVQANRRLQGEALADIRTANRARLQTLHQALADGQALPAWGDSRTCERCDMKRLCRRDAWLDPASQTDA